MYLPMLRSWLMDVTYKHHSSDSDSMPGTSCTQDLLLQRSTASGRDYTLWLTFHA